MPYVQFYVSLDFSLLQNMIRVDEIMPSFNENIIKGPEGIYFPDEEAYAQLNIIFHLHLNMTQILEISE